MLIHGTINSAGLIFCDSLKQFQNLKISIAQAFRQTVVRKYSHTQFRRFRQDSLQYQGSRRDQINDKHMWHMNILALKLLCIKHNLLLQQNSRYILTLTTLLRSSISYGSGTGGDYLCSRVLLLSELQNFVPKLYDMQRCVQILGPQSPFLYCLEPDFELLGFVLLECHFWVANKKKI